MRTYFVLFCVLTACLSAHAAPVSTNESAEVAFGYGSNWEMTHDGGRQGTVERCGLAYRRFKAGEITDAALDGVSLYVERCKPERLTDADRATLARFRARGGKVFPLDAKGGNSIERMLEYFEKEFPQFKEKLARGHALLKKVADDNRVRCAEVRPALLAGGEDEIRLILCHSAYGPRGMPYEKDPKWQNWDLNCARLRDWGFNMLKVNVCHAGGAAYSSSVVPVSPDVATRGDALEQLLPACRRHGLRLVAWRVCFRDHSPVSSPSPMFDRWIREGRGMVDADGVVSTKILCPNDPRNRRNEVDACVELARKGVWGVSLDYIRYDSEKLCFCERCRRRFAECVGVSRTNDWPKCIAADKGLKREWERFRRDTITSLVREIRMAVKAAAPSCRLLASVATPSWKDGVAQEWDVWCKEGLVDIIAPMNYYSNGYPAVSEIAGTLQEEKALAGDVLLAPTLYPVCIVWKPGSAEDFTRRSGYLVDSIREYRRAGLKAFGIFEFTNPFIDMVGMGGRVK